MFGITRKIHWYFKEVVPVRKRHQWMLQQAPALRKRGGVFVGLGANDGVEQDPTWTFEGKQGWHGVLVEPIPQQAAQCRRNRPKSLVRQFAIVGPAYEGETVRLHGLNKMSFIAGSRTPEEEKEREIEALPHLDFTPYDFEAPAITVSALLSREQITTIDLMALDIEGSEVEALNGLDFSRWRPSYFFVEGYRNREEIDRIILGHGYHIIGTYGDYDVLYERLPDAKQ